MQLEIFGFPFDLIIAILLILLLLEAVIYLGIRIRWPAINSRTFQLKDGSTKTSTSPGKDETNPD